MYRYDIKALETVFSDILKANMSVETLTWFNEINYESVSAFNTAFVMMPRKVGKAAIDVSLDQSREIADIRTGLFIDDWTTDKLGRVLLLMKYSKQDQHVFHTAVEKLFPVAEMNEQIALYAALPLLPYPEIWVKRCAEGIRSNIGTVLEAIMYHNPYPAENLDEAAWNQMILKAFFTDKQVDKIHGLRERANPELARILIDYAKERHAAGRQVDPMLWHLVERFVSTGQLDNMKLGNFQ